MTANGSHVVAPSASDLTAKFPRLLPAEFRYQQLAFSKTEPVLGPKWRQADGGISAKESQSAEALYPVSGASPQTKLRKKAEDIIAILRSESTKSCRMQAGVPGDVTSDSLDSLKDLQKAGCSIEDLSEALYEHFKSSDLPNFLPHVKLDRDGGLDRVEMLWNSNRYFYCYCKIGGALFNICFLVSLNWSIVSNMWGFYCAPLMKKLEVDLVQHRIDRLNHERVSGALAEAAFMKSKPDLFHNIEDHAQRLRFMVMASAITFCEILGIVFLFCKALRHIFRFVFSASGVSEFRAWHSIHEFFQETLPIMGTFSALKLAALVHPSCVIGFYHDYIKEATIFGYSSIRSTTAFLLATLWFLASRVLCAAIALMAFGTKTVIIGAKLVNPKYAGWQTWAEALVLLTSCIGTVLLEQQLQDRVFLFLFGGGDAEYQEEERSLRNVYRARLGRQIWNDLWEKRKQRHKAFALLATLDHFDLQRLVVETSSVQILEADPFDKASTKELHFRIARKDYAIPTVSGEVNTTEAQV